MRMWGQSHNQEARCGGQKRASRLSLTWLRQGDASPASEIVTPGAERATLCVCVSPGPSYSLIGAGPGDHAPGQHPLPGRVSKTSLWAATELTSFPRSSGCFSPGCGDRSAARRTGSPLPPAPPPAPAQQSRRLTRRSSTCCGLRPCFARMGCSASCSRLVGLTEIRTTRCSAANSRLHGTLRLR